MDTKKFESNGQLISTVERLSEKIEVETVFHGKKQPELLMVYLDADRRAADGSERPRVRIEMDGDRVKSIEVYKNGRQVGFFQI